MLNGMKPVWRFPRPRPARLPTDQAAKPFSRGRVLVACKQKGAAEGTNIGCLLQLKIAPFESR